MRLRKRVWEAVEVAKEGNRPSKIFDVLLQLLILLNVVAVVLESVEQVEARFRSGFRLFELMSVAVFTVEYAARLWSCVESPEYRHPIAGRLRFASKFMSLVDLLAFLPFYLPFVLLDLRFLRAFRMLRLVRLLKIGRYSTSMKMIGAVFRSKKEELLLALGLMVTLLVVSSCLIFYCEHGAQPESFPNIPATMWWAVETMTTVGYGDMCPVTLAGKIFGAIVAILGIAMFALPTGILGAGFVEEMEKKRGRHRRICPHCGKEVE